MKKRILKKIAILAAPIIWRRIRGRRGHHSWRRHRGWHGRSRHFGHKPRHFGHKRRGIWL
jgi:hypothetical protein